MIIVIIIVKNDRSIKNTSDGFISIIKQIENYNTRIKKSVFARRL